MTIPILARVGDFSSPIPGDQILFGPERLPPLFVGLHDLSEANSRHLLASIAKQNDCHLWAGSGRGRFPLRMAAIRPANITGAAMNTRRGMPEDSSGSKSLWRFAAPLTLLNRTLNPGC